MLDEYDIKRKYFVVHNYERDTGELPRSLRRAISVIIVAQPLSADTPLTIPMAADGRTRDNSTDEAPFLWVEIMLEMESAFKLGSRN